MSFENTCKPTPLPQSAAFQVSRLDLLIIGVIVIVSLSILLASALKPALASAAMIRIYKDNVQIKELDFNQTARVELPGMEIEIKNGAVRVEKSDCPRGICRHTGWITKPGSTLVCVPNRVLVEIAGKKKGKTYDAITY
jgi:hypothetical protein